MDDTAWELLAFPRLCALIAVKPSRLSQAMHNAGFRAMKLPFVYVSCDVQETGDAIQAMRKLGIRGYSLTIPHKENAFTLVDSLSPEAKEIGAINTVVNDGAKLSGHNTDWIGVQEALREAGVEVKNGRVLVAGAGGAARAAVYALKKAGAAEIIVVNRDASRAESLSKHFGVKNAGQSDLARIKEEGCSLVVNATPLGSKLAEGENPLNVFYTGKTRGPALFDMVAHETELCRAAAKGNAPVIPGSRMLLYQAFEQFRLFTGEEPPKEPMEKALQVELRNIPAV